MDPIIYGRMIYCIKRRSYNFYVASEDVHWTMNFPLSCLVILALPRARTLFNRRLSVNLCSLEDFLGGLRLYSMNDFLDSASESTICSCCSDRNISSFSLSLILFSLDI